MKTIDEIRRNNLAIAVLRIGTATKLAAMAGVSQMYLIQIKGVTLESKTGKRKTMGDDVARKIELALDELPGWMDADHSTPPQFSLTIEDAALSIGRKVPIVGTVQGGDDGYLEEFDGLFIIRSFRCFKFKSETFLALLSLYLLFINTDIQSVQLHSVNSSPESTMTSPPTASLRNNM